MNRPRVGISSCLLGDEVRYDGGHKRHAFLADVLAPHVEWVPVCPEVEAGMGVPREPLRLVRAGNDTRMIATVSGVDHTDAMRAYAEQRVRALEQMDLRGYVLKSKSPSCGMDEGIFATVLRTRLPELPVEEESRLNDPVLRDHFIKRVLGHDV
jgi:uncharacterized protein YbbK (DUF523 family)